MKTATIEITCDLCRKTAATLIFRWAAYQEMPHTPEFRTPLRGMDLCQSCDAELKAVIERLKTEKANARTP